MTARLKFALFTATLLAACAPIADPQGSASKASNPRITTPTMAPMDPSVLRTASILDVDLYTPQKLLTGCPQRPLPTAVPDAKLVSGLARAQAHSEAHSHVGLMVMQSGEVVYQDFADGVDASTPTASASMAKSVMALLMGIAIDKGMVASIDDPIGDYLEEWSDDPRGRITLRQALQMASGLGQADFMQLLFSEDSSAAALATPLSDEPGSTFYYSNAVSQLLAEVIDRKARADAYGGGYAEFLQRELWCPLGNGDAILWTDQTGMARGYAGLHTGLANWLRVGELIRNHGKVGDKQVVPSEWIAEMAKSSPANPQYGLHIWLAGAWTAERGYNPDNPVKVPHSEAYVATDMVYFDGFGGQRVYVIPSKGLTIARYGMTDITYDDAIIPNALVRALE